MAFRAQSYPWLTFCEALSHKTLKSRFSQVRVESCQTSDSDASSELILTGLPEDCFLIIVNASVLIIFNVVRQRVPVEVHKSIVIYNLQIIGIFLAFELRNGNLKRLFTRR